MLNSKRASCTIVGSGSVYVRPLHLIYAPVQDNNDHARNTCVRGENPVIDPIADAEIARLRDQGYTVENDYESGATALRKNMDGVQGRIVRTDTEVDAALFDAAEGLVIGGRAGLASTTSTSSASIGRGVIVANALPQSRCTM